MNYPDCENVMHYLPPNAKLVALMSFNAAHSKPLRPANRAAWLGSLLLAVTGCSQAPPPSDTDTTADTTADNSDTLDSSDSSPTGVSPTDTTDTTDPTDTDEPTNASDASDATDTEVTDSSDATTTDEPTTDEPTGPEPEPLDYYPVGDGYTWTYDHIDGTTGDSEWIEEVTMKATTWNGQAAWRVQDSPDASGVFDVQTWVLSGERIERVHRDEFQGSTLRASVDYTPGFTRFAAAWVVDGFTETITYTRDEMDASGGVDSKTRYQKYEVEAIGEQVEAGGKTYDDCVVVTRVRVDQNGDVQLDSANNADSNARYWYCRGVGKVKEENMVSGSREELIDYSL